jgi:hypothetical protein
MLLILWCEPFGSGYALISFGEVILGSYGFVAIVFLFICASAFGLGPDRVKMSSSDMT